MADATDICGSATESDADCTIDALARRYRPGLVRYFSRHLGNRDDAEDLAQEVFVRFVQHRAGRIDSFEAFLFQIAANLLRDRFRRNRTHHAPQHFALNECAETVLGEVPSEESVYEEQERWQAFLDVLEELPSKCRTVFLLQRFEGMTYGAIAQRLAISVSAVEKHMMKAMLHFDARLHVP